MTIITARIHPAIGIARVGDSDSKFFVGPERRWDPALPKGESYRDADHKIKRQAARFRVFAYHDDFRVEELTSANAEITWTVHLANRKAIARRRRARGNGPSAERNAAHQSPHRDGLVVDPGPHSVSGPGHPAVALDGKFAVPGLDPMDVHQMDVHLGDISTDADGHLLVLGGRGGSGSPTDHPLDDDGDSDEWFDDVSDGTISATVLLNRERIEVEGARVIVCPPKFAPPVGSVVRLWDALFEALADPAVKSARPSYLHDIYPILQAANDAGAVSAAARSQHMFVHRVKTSKVMFDILRRVTTSGAGHMPKLNAGPGQGTELSLTQTQKSRIASWAAGDFVDDWPAGADFPPPDKDITPDGLDKAALENCSGGALFPGVEAGKFLLDKGNYVEDFTVRGLHPSFRLLADIPPGEVTAEMSLPWAGDFHYCRNWWPAVRPDQVVPEGSPPGSRPVEWARDAEDLDAFVKELWAKLGFVTRRGGDLVETERRL